MCQVGSLQGSFLEERDIWRCCRDGRPYKLYSKWNDALGTDQALGGGADGLGVWDSAWVMDTA